MLRSFLIYLSKASWAQRMVSGWKFAWRAASRFVAGNTIEDAIGAVTELNANGINVTLDHLGESTATREDAIKAADDIVELLDKIKTSGVRANVSVKLTQIGLALDENLCSQNLERILLVQMNTKTLCASTWKILLIRSRLFACTGKCARRVSRKLG